MKIKRLIITLSLLVFLSTQVFSQTTDIIITKSFDGLSWDSFVDKLENERSIQFFFKRNIIPDFNVSVSSDSIALNVFLDQNLNQFNLKISSDRAGNVFITEENAIKTSLPKDFFGSKKMQAQGSGDSQLKTSSSSQFIKTSNEFVSIMLTVGDKKKGAGLGKALVSGSVRNAKDGSPIIGATLYFKELGVGTTTNDKGFYSIELPKGEHTLIVKSVETEEKKIILDLLSTGMVNISLDPKVIQLAGVEIRSEKTHNVRGLQMGYEKLTAKVIKEIPTVLGEKDIVKVALLLPGVQSVGEGSSGFNVRGSPADQNLYYVNSVPVYNTSHLFGFFSAFNPDAISDFTLYKSYIPSQYGGRLSSVFDISTINGTHKKFSVKGGISPITGRILAEGPILKSKSSYMIGLRSTYSDWILKKVKDVDIKNSKARFSDMISNLSFSLTNSDQLKLFSYYSYDKMDLASKTENQYENQGVSLSWIHTYKNKGDIDFRLIYSKYSFNEKNKEFDLGSYEAGYQLNHNEARLGYVLKSIPNHTINIGVNSILYKLDKGTYSPYSSGSLVLEKVLGEEQGIESAVYLNEEWKIHKNFSVTGGIRYNRYSYLGPGSTYVYKEDHSLIKQNIIDTLSFGDFENIKTYDGLDFRLAGKLLFSEYVSMKASYNKSHQFIFMLSNTIALSPTDKWKLADYNIKPMWGDQYSVGLYTNLLADMYQISLEAYYKKIHNLVEYKDGADFIVNEIPESELLQGELDSYGVEFMIKKAYGNLNGWINYTYSNATVLVDNPITGDYTNFGNPYPANYDKPHALNIVANYRFSKRISFSGNIVYSTGRPITYPTAYYYHEGHRILHYSSRNEYRLPDYFRIDASLNLEGNLLSRKLAHGSFSFSVYNLTGRNNAYSVYFKPEERAIKGYKLSVFGSPIYSITYNFKLGNYAD